MDVITANRLSDGRVVFRTAGGWSTDVSEAERLEGKEAVAAALAHAGEDAAANIVVEVYAIGVVEAEGRLVPAKLRERIRASGPTAGNSLHPAAAEATAA